MFKAEVNFRLAKWLIAMLQDDGIINSDELQELREAIGEYFHPPFLEVDMVYDTIGDGVTVGGR